MAAQTSIKKATGTVLLTPAEVEDWFGGALTRERLHYWRKTRTGPQFIRLGHRTLFYDLAVLNEYLERNTHIPSVRATIEEKRVHL